MTESELIAALEEALRASENPEDAYTTEELVDMWGMPIKQVRSAIKALQKLDRVEVVMKAAVRMDMRHTKKPAYRILAQ